MKLNKDNFLLNDTIELSINVKNTSDIDGYETIQVYSSDLYASMTPDIKRLREFDKINIKAGETVNIKFRLPVSKLGFVNVDNKYIVEPGRFKLTINNQNREIVVN